ncbi:MAG: thiamine phosphate synthase [Thermoprotei archaeon]
MSLSELPEGVYGITSGDFHYTQVEVARILLKAGVRIIQYREKKAPAKRMYEEALEIKRLCAQYGAKFIVNDRVDLALSVEADGVHIGQDDLPLTAVKKILPGGLIGVSARTVEQALEAEALGATYLGVGSIYPTTTKGDAQYTGEEGLKNILEKVSIPVYAIGGIKLEHVCRLKSFGVRGVAVISAILGEPDPMQAAKRFVEEWVRCE